MDEAVVLHSIDFIRRPDCDRDLELRETVAVNLDAGREFLETGLFGKDAS